MAGVLMPRELVQLTLLEQSPGHRRVERVLVREQRMHPVDGDELLRQRIRCGVMVGV